MRHYMNSKSAAVVIPFFPQYKELLHMYKTVSESSLFAYLTFTNSQLLSIAFNISFSGILKGQAGLQGAEDLDPGFSTSASVCFDLDLTEENKSANIMA